MQTSSPSESSSRWRAPLVALQHRDFLLLWLGSFVSTVGSQMRLVAVNLQIYQVANASGTINPALALGLVGLMRVIPIVLFSLFSGLVADRVDRRTILIVTSLAALVGSVVLAWTSMVEEPSLPLIYAMIIMVAVAGAFEMPARQSIVPNLVPAGHLSNALSLNIITMQLATVLGPSLAGLLIAVGGVQTVYWIDAASFLAVIAAAWMIRTRMARMAAPPVSFKAAFEGLKFVFQRPLLSATMLLDFFATFFGAAMTLLPLFADQVLHVGEVQLGILYAAPSAGAVLAAAALTTIRIKRQGVVLLWAVAIFGLCTAVFGISRSFPLTLLALFGTGVADTISMVIRQVIRQLRTPDELRGRMTAVGMIFFAGGPQLGEFESGVVASLMGGPFTVLVGGILCMIMVGITAWRVPQLRAYHGEE
ncbi:MAG TPA: MFS transporter [Roseiflexaceae bacterium]|jgi:MFS family permease|nr:MFS transporter [Roseiflexaceae bacterium]